jgi:hypothetical protein
MANLRVTCINKREHQNPHERITHIGGTGWKYTETDAISYIKQRTHTFYVHVGNNTIDVIVVTHLGREYLKTRNDGVKPDNLLSLPECS